MNKKTTLFIFEGEKPDIKQVESLEKHFLGCGHTIECVFGTDIYQFYRKMSGDSGFPIAIVALLKETSNKNATILAPYSRSSFAEVYLFSDYDAHATLADDTLIAEMLLFFDNETENGKLYISYPMVEAIRHYEGLDSFKTLTVKYKGRNCPNIHDCDNKEACLKEPHYKQLVKKSSPQLTNVNNFTQEVWAELITAHLFKANYLLHDHYAMPTTLLPQASIFSQQLTKHTSQHCPQVAVLSAFPLYVLDFFGCNKTQQLLRPHNQPPTSQKCTAPTILIF